MTDDESVERYGVGLSVDHLIPRREFMDDGELDWEQANQLHNLAPFCTKHHREWEGIPVVPEFID